MKMKGVQEVLISQEEIFQKISDLGRKISDDYKNEELVIVCILNGAFVYCVDLMRKIECPLEVEFMKCSSYGENTQSSGDLQVHLDLKRDIKGKNVLVVEDIVDTGFTLRYILCMLKSRKVKSLKISSLLSKPSRRKAEVSIDYLGFEIEDKFVVGYGLDYAGKFRDLPYIGIYCGD